MDSVAVLSTSIGSFVIFVFHIFFNLVIMAQRILETGSPILNERPSVNVPSNTFNLSHDVKLSHNIGTLVPGCVLECLPGDSFTIDTECLLRMQPMIAPVMHRMNVRSEWFYVPYRLLWDNWENFISPPHPNSVTPAVPTFQVPDVKSGDLANYLGLPIGSSPLLVSALPFAAYQRICFDWYMDEDISVYKGGVDKFRKLGDGDNTNLTPECSLLRNRNWDRDYFTSAKPWAQKGNSVVIPFHGPVPVTPVAGSSIQFSSDTVSNIPASTGIVTVNSITGVGQTTPIKAGATGSGHFTNPAYEITNSNLVASAGTIQELRNAEALQKFLEADARGGTQYIESLKQHWDVVSPDSRLQRCEYIGSTKQPISVSEVLNTTGTADAPQGSMAGHGVSVTRNDGKMHCYCHDHGILMCITSVLPVTGYYQGISKMWTRTSRFDYPWPEFAHMGEQPIKNIELFWSNNSATDNATFGYVPRYSEYRLQGNRVAGDFATMLDFWHLARKFTSTPALNEAFLNCIPDAAMDRIFAVTDPTVHHLLAHWFHKITVHRKLPRLVTPSI